MANVFMDEKKDDNEDLISHKIIYKFDFKTLLLPIMQKNRRSIFLGTFLIFFHFLTLFSLQFRSSDFPMQNGLMPSIHFVISKFNTIFLISSDSLKFAIMLAFLGFNMSYALSMLLLGFMGGVSRKNFFRNSLTRFHVYIFQIYNWMILIPLTHLSSYLIFADSSVVYYKVLSAINILVSMIIANFIEYSRININFKCEDSLDSRVDILDKIIINYKILVIFFAGVNFYIDYWLILLYFMLIADYFRKISFYVEKVSIIYLACIGCFFFAHLIYVAFYNNIIDLKNMDVSYLLFFGCSFIIKVSIQTRGFLVIHKLKIIAKYGIRTKLDFDLYIRETYSNLKNFRFNLDSKILFLSFFSIHQNRCILKDCACKIVKNNNNTSFLKNKKTFKRVVESYFIEFLMTVKTQDFEDVFLVYCSFITSILKIPSKALNLLLVNKNRINSLKNKILIEILVKKSKKSLEKRLLNNDQYAQSFATVILFDHQVRLVETTLRTIIINELAIGGLLINDNDFKNVALDKFFKIGKDVIHKIEKSKEMIKKLFDKNVNNVRLIQMTTLIIKYLSEDMSFRNFYKQLNIKRINQQILKRKKGQDAIDIFENDAGVVFLSLSKEIGYIKRFSKNIPKIFDCDSVEMKGKNITEFMPLVIAKSHNLILENFVKTGKAVLLISDKVPLFAITKQNFLLHINLIIRLDTFFSKEFMVGGFVKSMRNTMNKTILLDIHGNFINCSKEVSNFLNFDKISPNFQHKISMILLMPDIMEKLLPFNYQEIFLKKNTDFKMKGFLLAPNEIDEKNIHTISIKDKIYSCFKDFQESEDAQKKFQELRNEVALKLQRIMPQEFKFYRVHFTLIVQNFSNDFVNVRLIEIYDLFEIKDLKLQIQYLTRKNRKFKEMLKSEQINSPFDLSNSERPAEEGKEKVNIIEKSFEQHTNEISQKVIQSQNHLSINDNLDDNKNESYISASNRTEIDKKLKSLNEILSSKQAELSVSKNQDFLLVKNNSLNINNNLQILNNSDEEHSDDKASKNASSEQNLLASKPPNDEHLKPSLSTIEQEESEISFEREDQDFEERISLMSNNQMNQESTEESLNDVTNQTHPASQVSRVSSHASGDNKKSTIDVLMKVGTRKIYFLKLLNITLFILFSVVTITFFVLIRNETYILETTLQNSGVFHNQLSPLCVLVRDSTIFKFLYSGLLGYSTTIENDLITEIKSSLEFNNILLIRAFRSGIAQADSSFDFVYLQYVNATIENQTLYTILVQNSSNPLIQHIVPIKLEEGNLMNVVLNIPQSLLFFLSAAEHFYYVEILGDTKNSTDSYNYVFFLRENILNFIQSMLDVLEINKKQITGSVNYLNQLNLAFFLIMLFGIIYAIIHASYIAIKSKYKANKFCALFFNFQENEIDDRSVKLRHVLDRYFDRNFNLTNNTDFSNTSFKATDNPSSKQKTDLLSTDKLALLRSEFSSSNNKKVKHKHFKRSSSIKQIKGKKFQQFLFFFFFCGCCVGSILFGIYLSNYVSTNNFGANVIEITGDLESVESYVITLHIQYAINSILLGLYDETAPRKAEKIKFADELLLTVDSMQSQITDLTVLFKVTSTDHILTQLKYEFFTNDICELYNNIKENIDSQVDDVKEIANRLKGSDFCQNLLKNVLTKGSTSFAFEINEIFKQWQDFIRSNNFSIADLTDIIQTKEFIDINYALPYIYGLGLYDISLMMSTAESYFDSMRNDRLMWFIWAMIVICVIFIAPFQKLTKHLNDYAENSFSLIKIFPYTMISNNKMLENKISRISKQHKI